ncbi:PAS domain S-box protein [candidate division KSB1 bacterium]|nr:PAS domain S-box protein [candidate division KSB1 bacterium]NIR70769.1 PAS domain S-box protein [candidate division KSB1 bacterium]NIS23222.1 PAS domain S-box protein [candidate division KSB1 bacterium]NIT70082.1 PAS domain S-box protein [candidate division KSB1 bacterium]NIU23719.1 PAS domain S-box protein [candidate division KSB1 bacterium]
MDKNLHILILEDVAAHAQLMQRVLRKAGIPFSGRRVETEEAFLKALKEFKPDVILADYSLPTFDGVSALSKVQENGVDVPFIFVSGAIGEELAIETLKKGATDYVLKHRLSSLAPAVRRALKEAENRRARRQAEEALRKAHDELELKVKERTAELANTNEELKKEIAERKRAEQAVRESEERLSSILESALDAIITIDGQKRIQLFNHAAEQVFRCSAAEVVDEPIDHFLSESFGRLLQKYLKESEQRKKFKRHMWAPEGLIGIRADGDKFPVEATFSQVQVSGQKLYTIILRDINERKRAEAELSKLRLERVYLQEQIKSEYNFEEIVGASVSMKEVFKNIEKVAATDSTVLLTGETGTGKELVARAIHNLSRRKDNVLIKVNCGGLPAGLVESELFGHEKGAFTGAATKKKGRFELADGGTIFLDEVGELPLETQTKLLRVLQEQEFERVGGTQTIQVDVRVLAATNQNLEEAVAQGTFRSDLFYRLNIFPIHIPPLRERRDDIPPLTDHFVKKFSGRTGKGIDSISPKALEKLMRYDWPGNVRELANLLERAVILCEGKVLKPAHLGVTAQHSVSGDAISTLEEAERQLILKALEKTDGVVGGAKGAASLLGLKRTTLLSKMKKLGLY